MGPCFVYSHVHCWDLGLFKKCKTFPDVLSFFGGGAIHCVWEAYNKNDYFTLLVHCLEHNTIAKYDLVCDYCGLVCERTTLFQSHWCITSMFRKIWVSIHYGWQNVKLEIEWIKYWLQLGCNVILLVIQATFLRKLVNPLEFLKKSFVIRSPTSRQRELN